MKKIVLLLSMIVFGLSMQAQNVIALSDANLMFKYAGLATDTVSQTRTWNMTITPNSTYSLWYNMSVKITEVAATTQTAVALRAKMFDTDAWSTITTVNYKGTGSDTTIAFQEITTKKSWNYYNILITPTNGKIKATFIKAAFRK